MGQALKTLASGSEEKKAKEIGPIIENFYGKHIAKSSVESFPDFYQAVCQTVEEINKGLGCTQFRVPETKTLEEAYNKHHRQREGTPLTEEEFQKILQEVIVGTVGLTSFGAKDILLYMFGVPITTLFVKQRVAPKSVPNDIFIPVITSATVFLLAKLNKI